jgi:hypothetical protein
MLNTPHYPNSIPEYSDNRQYDGEIKQAEAREIRKDDGL